MADAARLRPLIVIPARMAASRLPGKPLADICGKPMIVRVWEVAQRWAAGVEGARVVVAAGGRLHLNSRQRHRARLPCWKSRHIARWPRCRRKSNPERIPHRALLRPPKLRRP